LQQPTEEERMSERDGTERPEDRPGEPGAEGGAGSSAETPPPLPSEDDDTPLGDTDQHSSDPA
jgi:hypothetical protein